MSVNDLRVAITILSFLAFAAIVRWAWAQRNRGRFDEAAQLPFSDAERAEQP